MIPYGRQSIIQSDIESVIKVLNSDWLTQGPQVPLFEKTVSEYCGTKYAVATNSATSALHIACLALELGQGDILWTTPITFVASANCALYCGATVNFVDIDPHTYNMSIEDLKAKLQVAEKKGLLPKIIVAVHFAGQPCDIKEIYNLSLKYGFKIIEDASHAIGASYSEFKVGSCTNSDVTIFSFHPVKIITTGEGGMALTNNSVVADRMRLLRSHGITRDISNMTKVPDGEWYYEQIELGFNYRMTDIQAALGISQMQRLNAFVEKRNIIAAQYNNMLDNLPILTPKLINSTKSAWHLYVIRINTNLIAKSRDEVFSALRSRGIGVNVHYIPVHLQPYYQRFGFARGDFLNAEAYYDQAITLPIYPTISDSQINFIVDSLEMNLKK